MESPGQRLKAFIRAQWGRKKGGDVALAADAGIRRQTLQDWYAGKDTPSLGHLGAVADSLGVRRVDLVAAYDGVTAPTTEEAAPPEWVERLLTGVMALEDRSEVSEDELARAQARAAIYLAAGTQKRPRPGNGGAGGAGAP